MMNPLTHLVEALAAFVATGRTADRETYARRLDICGRCELLRGTRCGRCGCFVALKARLPRERCPLGRWDGVPADEE